MRARKISNQLKILNRRITRMIFKILVPALLKYQLWPDFRFRHPLKTPTSIYQLNL